MTLANGKTLLTHVAFRVHPDAADAIERPDAIEEQR
jgi:hypothetical protein